MKESSLIKNYSFQIRPGGSMSPILRITFQSNGATYDYYNVPMTVFDEFEQAESLGKYFIKNIRDKYEFRKIEEAVLD